MLQRRNDLSAQRSHLSPGVHCILELYHCQPELLNQVAFVRQTLQEATVKANATLIEMTIHQFHPQGITALALLAESHLSIHTWPETGYAAVDLFTCSPHTTPEPACLYLVQAFGAREHSLIQLLRRNTLSPDPLLPTRSTQIKA